MARPKKPIDYDLVDKLAQIHCTQEEIAEIVGVTTRTLQRDKEFCRIYKKGISTGKMSLRRKQWAAAEKGNTTMLIWLGKQYLDQKDDKELNQIKKDELALKKAELDKDTNAGKDASNIEDYVAALKGEVKDVFADEEEE